MVEQVNGKLKKLELVNFFIWSMKESDRVDMIKNGVTKQKMMDRLLQKIDEFYAAGVWNVFSIDDVWDAISQAEKQFSP